MPPHLGQRPLDIESLYADFTSRTDCLCALITPFPSTLLLVIAIIIWFISSSLRTTTLYFLIISATFHICTISACSDFINNLALFEKAIIETKALLLDGG